MAPPSKCPGPGVPCPRCGTHRSRKRCLLLSTTRTTRQPQRLRGRRFQTAKQPRAHPRPSPQASPDRARWEQAEGEHRSASDDPRSEERIVGRGHVYSLRGTHTAAGRRDTHTVRVAKPKTCRRRRAGGRSGAVPVGHCAQRAVVQHCNHPLFVGSVPHHARPRSRCVMERGRWRSESASRGTMSPWPSALRWRWTSNARGAI